MTSEIKYSLSPNPVLYFSDNEGKPLVSGKLWFFKATAHAVEKAVYKERLGSPTPTAWIQPITLDAGGHAIDPTSSSIKPVYFADDENYYLHFVKSDDSSYYDEDNFNSPANLLRQESKTNIVNLRNYILNSQFRFIVKDEFKGSDDDLPENKDITIAAEGWTFRRNNEQGEITISFKQFAEGQSDVENTPTNYLNFNKTGFGTGGETENDIIYALGNTQDFSAKTLSFGLTGLSNTSANISVYVRQFFGTGGTPSATVDTPIDVISLDGSWNEKSLLITVPSVAGKNIGTNKDDVLSLVFRGPLNAVAQFSLTNFQLNIGTQLQIYDKKTLYDDGNEAKAYPLPIPTLQDQFSVLKVGESGYFFDPETGKIDTYLFGDVPDGYAALDDTTYARTDKVGTSQVTYDRLYQKWDNDTHLASGNAFGYGEDGFFPMAYPTAGANLVFVNEKRDTTITAWDAGTSGFTVDQNRTGGDKGFLGEIYTEDESRLSPLGSNRRPEQHLSIENVEAKAVTIASIGTMPVQCFSIQAIQTGTASLKNVVVINTLSDFSNVAAGQYFLISSHTTDYYVWFTVNKTGTDPAVATRTGIRIDIERNMSMSVILNKIKEAFNAKTTEFNSYRLFGLQIDNKIDGAVSPFTKETSNVIISEENSGSATSTQLLQLIFSKGEFITAGSHFNISSTITDYYVWFKKDGVGPDPVVAARTGIAVDINSDDLQVQVVLRIKQAIEGTASNEITSITPASSLTGGEYILLYNDDKEFYAWFTVDQVGTDPDLSGKTGIKIELISTDTDVQVAQKLSKGISSYYFVIPTTQGYFLRSRDKGKGIDTSAETRLPRGDGTAGDNIGTLQVDTNKAHNHSLASNEVDSPAVPLTNSVLGLGNRTPGHQANIIASAYHEAITANYLFAQYYEFIVQHPTVPYVSDQGFEARPKNINVLDCIKI